MLPFYARKNMICGGRGGAPRLRAAALSSLPAMAAFSPAASIHAAPLQTLPPPALGRVRTPFAALSRFRRFLFGRAAARSPLPALRIAARANPFPLAGVRASCGRARPATQPTAHVPCVDICLGRVSRVWGGCLRSRVIKISPRGLG